MLQGLRTVIYGVTDIERAKAWYTKALGVEPYFAEPFYVGFNVGGYELGLDPHAGASTKESAGVIADWGVDDIHAEVKRMAALGASVQEEVKDVGSGILVARVADPFGNLIGLIRNPNFKLP